MDPYKILELSSNATQDDVRAQYRKLCLRYHPDVNPAGEEKFKEIGLAYKKIMEEWKPAKPDSTYLIKYYRFFGPKIKIPSANPSVVDIIIFCMMDSGKELRITLTQGTQFPTTIRIKNLDNYEMVIDNER